MAGRIWTKEECIKHFKEQEPQIIANMKDGEKYKHCLDYNSFGGACYDPMKVITSSGQVWGLRQKGFLNLEKSLNAHGYKRTMVSGSAEEYNQTKWMTVHKLVANYFCDKTLIEVMEAVNAEQQGIIFDLSLDRFSNYKIVDIHHVNSNKLDNREENLQYIYTEVHDLLTALHNNDNLAQNVREKAIRKLESVGLNNPEDKGLKIMVDNASSPDTKLYGYVIKDGTRSRGFRMEIKTITTIKGDPNYKFTEEEYIKMKIATSKAPDYIG